MVAIANRVALITGGDRGIGKSITAALADSGISVGFTYYEQIERARSLEHEILDRGKQGMALQLDLLNRENIRHVIRTLRDKWGPVQILVNNAATGRINLPPEETSLDQWNFVIDTNLTGMFICSKAVGKEMIKQRKGKIINLASISGSIINKGVHGGSYDVSKSAIVALTRALAVEWAPYNINVNAIAPGYFLTEPNIKFFEADQDFYRQVVEMVPLKRIGDPNELKGTVIYLASEASNFMTGSIVVVDGGYTLW